MGLVYECALYSILSTSDVPGDAIAVEEHDAEEKDRQDPDKRFSSMKLSMRIECKL